MIKEGGDIAGAIRSSQELARKVSKIFKYVERVLGGNESKSDKYDPTISHKRGYVKRDE